MRQKDIGDSLVRVGRGLDIVVCGSLQLLPFDGIDAVEIHIATHVTWSKPHVF